MIGKRIGNYQVVSLLGRGGMGSVYLAEHPQIGRKVAIKVLRDEVGRDPQVVVRFLNEARAANAIRHPNIIEIVDAGTAETGEAYLVMELLEGEELSKRIKRVGRLQSQHAAEIVLQTTAALQAAHDARIVHRDLKPDNLFLIADPVVLGAERVKVLDFGIAKLHTLVPDAALKTQTGTIMGTPIYMSPEQCLGTREIDFRSDIYSLGCIFYEMLAGQPPFRSEGVGELIHMHINLTPPPLRDLVPVAPPALVDLITAMLAKKPEDRPADMHTVGQAIRRALGTLGETGSTDVSELRAPDPPRVTSTQTGMGRLAIAETQAAPSAPPGTITAPMGPSTRRPGWLIAGGAVILLGGLLAVWRLINPGGAEPPGAPATTEGGGRAGAQPMGAPPRPDSTALKDPIGGTHPSNGELHPRDPREHDPTPARDEAPDPNGVAGTVPTPPNGAPDVIPAARSARPRPRPTSASKTIEPVARPTPTTPPPRTEPAKL